MCNTIGIAHTREQRHIEVYEVMPISAFLSILDVRPLAYEYLMILIMHNGQRRDVIQRTSRNAVDMCWLSTHVN